MPSIVYKKSPSGTCLDVVAHLSDYLDGELPADIRVMVEAHLAACPSCRELARSLKLMINLCHELGRRPPPRPMMREERQRLWDAWLKSLDASPCHS